MRYAVIDGNSVINVIEAYEGFALDGYELVQSDEAGPGWAYLDGVFSPPPAPKPEILDRVTARQFKLQLLAAGLLDDVEAWVSTQDRAVQIAFEYSGTFARNEPMMQTGFDALGFTEEQINEFFLSASQI